MNKEFVPYEESLALKELGFDEKCLAFFFDEDFELNVKESTGDLVPKKINSGFKREPQRLQDMMVSAPLWQQAFRWFREKHGLESIVQKSKNYQGFKYKIFRYSEDEYVENTLLFSGHEYETYKEAELECVRRLLTCVLDVTNSISGDGS